MGSRTGGIGRGGLFPLRTRRVRCPSWVVGPSDSDLFVVAEVETYLRKRLLQIQWPIDSI